MKVDPEFKNLLPALSSDAFATLKSLIETEGCTTPLAIWKEEDILLDGHNRLAICEQIEIKTGEPCPYNIHYVSLPDRTAAKIWIYEHQEGRRNSTKSQSVVFALELEALYAEQAKERQRAAGEKYGECHPKEELEEIVPQALDRKRAKQSRDKAAEAVGVSGRQVSKAKLVKNRGAPGLLDKVRSGELSVDAANRVSLLPEAIQKAALERGPEVLKKVSTVVNDATKIEKAVPGIIEKAATKLILGEASSAKDAISQVSELEEFEEFDQKMRHDVQNAQKEVAAVFNGTDKMCFLPNMRELWCNDCEWGFDTYLPEPCRAGRGTVSCPYCGNKNVGKRETGWSPGRIQK